MSIWSRLRKAVHELTGPTPAPVPQGRNHRAARERTKRRHARRAARTGITETVRRRIRAGGRRPLDPAWAKRYRDACDKLGLRPNMDDVYDGPLRRFDTETRDGQLVDYTGALSVEKPVASHEHEWIDITTIGGEAEEFCPRCSEKRPKARDVVFSSPGYPTSWYGDRYRK